ncbi:reverse transcriptase domain-containing protein [Tanacetum coccineum]|uniref:Reverse transcriptase domain-containing protein n=1 Tax=Tanacetum coccineum TaxID=301880 RepID=A0ABQ5HYZ1_9ASTR
MPQLVVFFSIKHHTKFINSSKTKSYSSLIRLKTKKTKSSLKKIVAFTDEGSSNSETDKFMARMDAMTKKIDAQYKEFQSRSKQPNPDHNDDDKPMSPKEDVSKRRSQIHANLLSLTYKQSARPFGSLPSNILPNPKGSSSKPYQPPQARNEHVNDVFTWSGKSYDPLVNPNDQQNDSENPINFDSDDEDEEPIPQPKVKELKPECRTMENFLKNSKAFSCNALADLGASINLMPYSLYAKLSLKTLKPTKMSVILTDRSFQHPIGIAENMLVEVGKIIFLVDFVILEMEEDNKVPLILRRPFLHTADAVIQVKQKQLNLGVGNE